MLTQTLAVFLDAYRELNSKKLFWITLGLSLVIVLAFACVGLTPTGMKVLWFEFDAPFSSALFPPALFYKIMFQSLGVAFWLGWGATILALISTAGIFPDLLSSGSIELTLSRPIGRLRLFATKYVAGLLFTGLQVLAFTAASFFVLGLRGGVWEPGLFWTVPLMVAMFSFLFCICVLIGVITRSTIAALLVTMLIWLGIFGIHSTERTLFVFTERSQVQVERLESDVKRLSSETTPTSTDRLERKQKQLTDRKQSKQTLDRWHTGVLVVKTFLPKTTETRELLERTLVSQADMQDLRKNTDPAQVELDSDDVPVDQRKVMERVQDKIRDRSSFWILGTSLGFEALILSIAAWLFCRRDF